jgi:2-polyprenyl-3-methyl-5-hydroxy-6-metoxy-1,4-benzoquinol methylase
MTSSAATATSGATRVLEVVNEFYESNPFPGFNPGKYETRRDLVARASWYGKMIDAEIPYGASVIDVGCGTGQLPCFLALKDRRVMGVDYSQHSLDLARTLADRLALKNVGFKRVNILDWDMPPNAFDYVFCNGVLHHTGDPYGGFQNLVKITKPGGYLVIGLYNRYGRLMLLVRRRIVKLLSLFDANAKNRAIKKQLVELEDDEAKRHTWFADQYEHPHESTHTVGETLGWFETHGIDYVSSFPKIEPLGSAPKRMFTPRKVARWRSTGLAHLLTQLVWIITQNAGGGYYVIVGRKRS